MFPIIVIAILALATVILGIIAVKAPKTVIANEGRYNEREIEGPRGFFRILTAGGVLATLIVTALFSFVIVQPRTVGVVVAFGKPVDVIDHGFHVKAPWEKVEKLDGAVQNDIYSGETAIPVRLGNNGKATVDASIQWQLKTDEAMDVFLDYRTFDGIRSNLVDRNFKAALNEVMATYDPLNYADEAEGGKDLAALSQAVQEEMQARVGNQIEVRSVTLPLVNFDEATQARVNELQAESAKTRVAEQKKQTSTAEAEANKILEQSVTDETLTSKCLDIVRETKQSPIGCFPTAGTQPVTITNQPEAAK